MQGEEVDLAHWAPVRADLRYHVWRKRDLGLNRSRTRSRFQSLSDSSSEDQLQVGEPKERKRSQMHHMRDAVHHDFQRNRDLLFDLLRRDSGPLRNDLDINVAYVSKCLNRKVAERHNAPRKKYQGKGQHQQTVVESKINEPANHSLLPCLHPAFPFTVPACFAIPERSKPPGRLV